MGMQNHTSPMSLEQAFGALNDPRRDQTKRHELIDILMIAVCCLLCSGSTFVDMERFGHAKRAWLQSFLALPNGIPSHDTFRRLFGLLNPRQFAEAFSRWTQSLRAAVSAEVVALDGKTLRRSFDARSGRAALHLVSAWASANRLVLGQVKTADKSNEITAVPELIRALELAGCIVTVDALNCQKNIAKEVSEADADYVMTLKANHALAYAEVKSFFDDAQQRGFAGIAHQYCETVEKEHGRLEQRRYWITEAIDWFAERDQWEKLRSMALVEAQRTVNGQTSTERRYYFCSIAADAALLAQAVRQHWGIENQLHWVLDVQLDEDQCRVRSGYAAENLATLRKIALNLLRKDPKRRSIRGKQLDASWDHAYLQALLRPDA
jgi:predicted transposase YbfD/YdcC